MANAVISTTIPLAGLMQNEDAVALIVQRCPFSELVHELTDIVESGGCIYTNLPPDLLNSFKKKVERVILISKLIEFVEKEEGLDQPLEVYLKMLSSEIDKKVDRILKALDEAKPLYEWKPSVDDLVVIYDGSSLIVVVKEVLEEAEEVVPTA